MVTPKKIIKKKLQKKSWLFLNISKWPETNFFGGKKVFLVLVLGWVWLKKSPAEFEPPIVAKIKNFFLQELTLGDEGIS